MRIVEIRDLDGPNLFLQGPAIKVELADVPDDQVNTVIADLSTRIAELHHGAGVDVPVTAAMVMEEPGHVVVAFAWQRREFARSLGCWAAQVVIGVRSDPEQIVIELRAILEQPAEEDDAPLVVPAAHGRIPIVAITGTNGKTTTSRLIAFVLRHGGHTVGLTSSAGVFINNQAVLSGDYSGPSGARRVLAEQGVDYAVLETARGGMLLRGCGYDQADVAVVTNVSEDHLGLHGIHSIEGLAAVKAIVARNVKPGGFCVLNAEDPHVLAMKAVTPGEPVLFSADPTSAAIVRHVSTGGSAVHIDAEHNVVWSHDGTREVVTELNDVPMTFGGRASHQVENALGATAALIGLGVPLDHIRAGLAAFTSTAENSKGRLNVFEIDGATVIIDFAHNEAGLQHLLTFARSFVGPDGRLISVVGTAGDREDQALRAIAKRAVLGSDEVVLKDTVHYLRGREPGSMLTRLREGVEAANRPDVPVREAADERSATLMMVDELRPHDVLAVMCVEDYDFLLQELAARGNARV